MCTVKNHFRKSVILAFALPALLFTHPVDVEPDCPWFGVILDAVRNEKPIEAKENVLILDMYLQYESDELNDLSKYRTTQKQSDC